MTINKIVELFRDLANRHEQIHDFAAVQDFNIDADDAPIFPILVVNPVSATLPKGENGYTSHSIVFDLQVIDLTNKDNNNELDVLSDTMQILTDVVIEFSTHPDYINDSLDLVSDISFDSLRGVYDSDVDGWKVQLEFEQPSKDSYCNIPINSK